jgi:hypothetical protein
MQFLRSLAVACLIPLCCACVGTSANKSSGETGAAALDTNLTTASGEPAYITVQHCLISFAGTPTRATRSQAEAEKLALELFEKAKAGADFDSIIRGNTDDSPPGIYRMANHGFPGDKSGPDGISPRASMVPAFGNTGFPLQVGQYGLAVFDRNDSPFGWHIVKRLK